MRTSSDFFDVASQVEMEERDAAIAKARGRIAGVGRATCSDCDDVIPQERRRAIPSCTRCVDCQERFEKIGRR